MKTLNLPLTSAMGRLPLPWMDPPDSFYRGQSPLPLIDAFEIGKCVLYSVGSVCKNPLFGHFIKPENQIIRQSYADVSFCHNTLYINETFKYLHYIALHSKTHKGGSKNERKNKIGCRERAGLLQRSIRGTTAGSGASEQLRGRRNSARAGNGDRGHAGRDPEQISGYGERRMDHASQEGLT